MPRSLLKRVEALEAPTSGPKVFVIIIAREDERDEKMRSMREFQAKWPERRVITIVIARSAAHSKSPTFPEGIRVKPGF